VEALSHGNQQRVQLAAALVHQPDVLILDEPFAGLDPIAADVLRSEAARGVPVRFSSHQLELVEQLCESVAIIDHGRLVACSEVEALRSRGPRLIRIDVPDAAPDWIEAPTDVELVERTGSRTVLKLGSAADPQRILDTARRSGSVTYFAQLQPTLAELFREAPQARISALGPESGPTARSSQPEAPGANRLRASCKLLSGDSAPALPNLQRSGHQAAVTP
jgi:ABC-2 type transport system ATP-binding protein